MSKGNGSSDVSLNDIIRMIGETSKGNDVDPVSQSFYRELLTSMKALLGDIKDLKSLNQSEKTEIKKILGMKLKDMGISSSSNLNEKIDELIKGLSRLSVSGQRVISDEVIAKNLTKIIADATAQSSAAIKRGKPQEALLKGLGENEKQKGLLKEVNNYMKATSEGFWDKLESFFGEHFHEAKKNLRAFGADLIEGLAANKFVGGALKDTFKLIGLLGASWLSHFGRLGQILGTAFYVAMETAGPLLATLLVKGLGSIIGKGFLTLGNTIWKAASFIALGTGKGLMNLSVRGGGSIAELATAGSIGQKVSAVAKVGGALGGGALGLGGAFLAGREAVKDWKSGNKGRATAFGVGAGFLGAGGIAAIATLFTAAAAPFVAPLLAIGAGIAGLTALWKKFGSNIREFLSPIGEAMKKVKEWLKPLGEFMGKVMEFLALTSPIFFVIKKVMDWILETKMGEKIKEVAGKTWSNVKNFFGFGQKQDEKQVEKIGELGLNQAGGMLGIRKMDKMQASKAVSEYIKRNPNQFNNAYELSGSKYSYLGSFYNDLAIRNAEGKAVQAVLYKGAGADLEGAWQQLVSSGAMTKERAELLKYTSGRATASSSHKKGGARSHDNVMNMVTDLGVGNNWSDSEWKSAFEALRSYYADKGFDLYYEGVDSKGKTQFGQEFVAGLSNRHFHIAPSKGKEGMMPGTAQANIEARKVVAEQHSMDAAYILMKEAGKGKVEEINREANKNKIYTQEEISKMYEAELAKMGIYNRPFTTAEGTQGIWVRETDEGSKVIDYSENSSFTEDYLRNVTRNGAGQ